MIAFLCAIVSLLVLIALRYRRDHLNWAELCEACGSEQEALNTIPAARAARETEARVKAENEKIDAVIRAGMKEMHRQKEHELALARVGASNVLPFVYRDGRRVRFETDGVA